MSEASRTTPRLTVAGEIHMRKSGYHKMAVELMDLSPTGCRMELPEKVEAGETVWITLPGLQSIEARVAWCRDWIAGVSFVGTVHPAIIDRIAVELKRNGQ